MARKTSIPKYSPPLDPKSRKLSRHMSFNESDDEEDEVNPDSHREHIQSVCDLEASQSLRTSPVHQPPIPTSMSADALSQLVVTAERRSLKTPTKSESTKKVIKRETMTMDRRNYSKRASQPDIKVTNTDTKSMTDSHYSNKAATLPGRGRKTAATGPYVPKFLLNRRFYWDRIQIFLERATESMDKPLHDTLPPQDTPWMKETSAVEQLRVFLETQP